MKSYECHYTGFGYPSKEEIDAKAKAAGYKYSFWTTESICYNGFYNGDTVVVYTDLNDLPNGMKEDAIKYGKEIQ